MVVSDKEKQNAVFDLTNKCLEIRQQIKGLNQSYYTLREEIAGILDELGVKSLRNEDYEVKIALPHTFIIRSTDSEKISILIRSIDSEKISYFYTINRFGEAI
ncbi:MAG: hypothetical protein ACXAEX_18615 [Promethearchaeota archaeon]|jgi:hypothetical protein